MHNTTHIYLGVMIDQVCEPGVGVGCCLRLFLSFCEIVIFCEIL